MGKGLHKDHKKAGQEAFAVLITGCILELKAIYRGPNPTLWFIQEKAAARKRRQLVWGDACVHSRKGVTSFP